MMDPHDDFQFKPLTEGLGFHKKKATQFKTQSGLDDKLISKSASLEMLESPLPRKREPVTNPAQKIQKSTVEDILKTLNDRRKLSINDEVHTKPMMAESKWKSSSWELPAGILDLMLVVALQLAGLIALLAATKVDLFGNLANPDSEGMVYWALLAFVSGFTWIYMVATRLFLGSTPGEWVFDQRIGRPEQFGSASYSFKIALRGTLIMATCFVVIPFLSVLFDKDVLGKMLGLELVKKI